MPTHEELARFLREYARLSHAQRVAFKAAVRLLVAGLEAGHIDPRLRETRPGPPGVWEMTWAPDGRATFHYGPEIRAGDPHLVWRRIGTHAILRQP